LRHLHFSGKEPERGSAAKWPQNSGFNTRDAMYLSVILGLL